MFYKIDDISKTMGDTTIMQGTFFVGNLIPYKKESLADLPKYASCRFFRFKIAKFREATYRLLTENQKVEFHKKALKYLQRNTIRCVSCGGGFFTKLLGQSYHMSPKGSRQKLDDFDDILDLADFDSTHRTILEAKEKSEDTRKWSRRFIMSEPELMPKTFDNLDFTNCECNFILITVYTQILDHCRGIDRKDKVLTTILEFVEVLLATFNIPQALKLLIEAEEILNQIFRSRDDELVTYPYLKGKIKTLQAKCHLQNAQVDEALRNLEDAISSMGYNFPKSIVMIKLKSRLLLLQQKLMLTCLRDRMVGVADGDAANYNDQLSKCLSQMFIVFRIKGMHKHAELAAIWSLNAALVSSKDFLALCIAYANMIRIAHKLYKPTITVFLENDGLMICNKRENNLELHELQAVAELYSNVCYSRLLKNESDKFQVSFLGFITLRLTRAVRSVQHELLILPRLIYLLIIECRFKEVPPLLERLEFIANSDMDKSGRTWYYALGVDLQLDTGIRIASLEKCEHYYQEEGKAMVNARDPAAKGRYFTSMWLWHLRMGDWEASIVWRWRKISATFPMDEPTVISSITALKELEGLLILYVHKIDSRNSGAIQEALLEIEKQFKVVEKLTKIVKPILARYVLLKAYRHMILSQSQLGLKLLQQSKRIADDTGNEMIYAWADHCEKAWTGTLTINQKDKWKQKCKIKSTVDENFIDNDKESVVFYTLPLPKDTPRSQKAFMKK